MTNHEWLCQSPGHLAAFLLQVQDDALEAKGCSLEMTMPPGVSWLEWLGKEYDGTVR